MSKWAYRYKGSAKRQGLSLRLYTEVMKRIITEGEAQDSNAIVEMSLKLAHIRTIREDFENTGRFLLRT